MIKDLASKLQDLIMQRTYSEDMLEEMTKEVACVEYRLRVTCSSKRRNGKTKVTIARPNNNTNSLQISDIVLITNKYLSHKEGAKIKLISASHNFVILKNPKTCAIYRK